MNFLELAEEVLKQVRKPLTHIEIWEMSQELGFDKSLKSTGKTPWATLGSRLYVAVRDNPSGNIVAFGKRPVRFGLKSMSNVNIDSLIQAIPHEKNDKYDERDLHPLLVKFADSYFHFRGAKLKTIYHEKSKQRKKGFNKWIHPDLAGVYFSFDDQISKYEKVIIDFQNDFSIVATKLFSFELKLKINFSNLREYYFQAVSNSSWANEGYLVALEFDEDLLEEIRRLANSFGIGFIKLNAENIEEGQIIVPAKYRENLDIDTMDRLASENKDFANFLHNIINDNKSKQVNSQYDKVMGDDEMLKYLTDKNII
ncbi:MAG: HrgA protein [Bacteroidetes bacterium]|nr:HrgA protein [Bacteroidota bacterium]